jgi:hypothetical protein
MLKQYKNNLKLKKNKIFKSRIVNNNKVKGMSARGFTLHLNFIITLMSVLKF